MNAVAPPGLKSGPRRSGAEDEAVRLTIDFDDADDLAGLANSAGQPTPNSGRKTDGGKASKAARASVAPPPDQQHVPSVPPQLASIEVTLSVEIGSKMVPLRELLALEPGQLFALDRMTTEPVTILVNGKPFAHGEVVAIGERFGVRLLDLLPGGSL